MSKWIGMAPNACFSAQFPPPLDAREQISRILEDYLCARFGAVTRGVLWRWPRLPRIINFRVLDESIWVGWHPNRFKKGQWILTVASGDTGLWDHLWGRKNVAYTQELIQVCRDIHSLLVSVTGISGMMWYFDGFRRQGRKAVLTPDDLPWSTTV
jgi:hypothetical protein